MNVTRRYRISAAFWGTNLLLVLLVLVFALR